MYIKTEIALVNQIKGQQELARQRLSQEEKSDIINAMNEEAKLGVHNIVGGRWFVCENGHPYYIGKVDQIEIIQTTMLTGFIKR